MGHSSSNAKLLALCSAAVMSVTNYGSVMNGTAPITMAQAATTSDSSSVQAAVAAAAAAEVAANHAKAAEQAAAKAAAIAEAAAKTAQTQATVAKAAADHADTVAKANPKSTTDAQVASAKTAVAKTWAAKAAVTRLAAIKAAKLDQVDAKAASAAIAAAKVAAAKANAIKLAAAGGASGTGSTVQQQKYKDGTYTGVGQTRIGDVQVQVTLKADKITGVQITDYTTHYPISYIDPILPRELMKTQDINKIDVISGATLSTEDFYYAVTDCLQQAQRAQTA